MKFSTKTTRKTRTIPITQVRICTITIIFITMDYFITIIWLITVVAAKAARTRAALRVGRSWKNTRVGGPRKNMTRFCKGCNCTARNGRKWPRKFVPARSYKHVRMPKSTFKSCRNPFEIICKPRLDVGIATRITTMSTSRMTMKREK